MLARMPMVQSDVKSMHPHITQRSDLVPASVECVTNVFKTGFLLMPVSDDTVSLFCYCIIGKSNWHVCLHGSSQADNDLFVR